MSKKYRLCLQDVLGILMMVCGICLFLYLNNCASHSRYFSDELGALFFKKQAEQMFVFSLCIWYNKNMDKNMFNINNNEFSYGR